MKVLVFWLISSCGFLWKRPFRYFIDTKIKAWPLPNSKNKELIVAPHITLAFLKQICNIRHGLLIVLAKIS